MSEATVCRTIRKVEDALECSKKFRLPGKKVLQSSNTGFEVVLVDVSEQSVERPKKPKRHYQWQKKHHTQKAQVTADRKSAQVVIEHIFRKLKVFHILSEMYRNRRERFALRFNLIAAIYNLELNSN